MIKRFDVGILEGDKLNPMHHIIHQRTGTWWTHAVLFKNEKGDIWDARMSGIEDNNISKYLGRKVAILRNKNEINRDQLEQFMASILPLSEGYDYSALIGFLTGIESFNSENRWYCAELPYWLFQSSNYALTRVDRIFVYPYDLYCNNEFELVYEGFVGGLPNL